MTDIVLDTINTELHNLGVPYEFMRWTSAVEDRYWVGEFSETPTDTEDGYEEGTLILTGTTKQSWLKLIQDKTKIKDHFSSVGGLRKGTDIGTVVFFYENSFPVDTGEADLKRMQINIHVKTWKGMN